MSDGWVLAGAGLFSTGCAVILARYGLSRCLCAAGGAPAVPGLNATVRAGMVLAALGLVISSRGVIEQVAWAALAVWAACLPWPWPVGSRDNGGPR